MTVINPMHLASPRGYSHGILAEGRLTVNAICPGWLNTGMTVNAIERIVAKTGRTTDDVRQTLEQMNPQKR